MKKIVCFIAIAGLVFGVTASEGLARTKKPKADAVAQKRTVSKKAREIIEKKRSELDNTRWGIEIGAPSGENKSKDLLVFKDKKFSVDGFASLGFAPADYSLTINDEGIALLETMQSSEKEGIVFWKIEFLPGNASLRGMLSRVSVDQTSQDLYFSGSRVLEPKTEQ